MTFKIRTDDPNPFDAYMMERARSWWLERIRGMPLDICMRRGELSHLSKMCQMDRRTILSIWSDVGIDMATMIDIREWRIENDD